MPVKKTAASGAKSTATKAAKTAKTTEDAKPAKAKVTKRRGPIATVVTPDDQKQIVVTVPPLKTPRFLEGFVDFVRTQGVVGLAVGLVLGTAAKSVVDSMVNNIFNPIIGMVGVNGGNLDGRFVCLKTVHGACTNKLGYGQLISNILSFLIVAAVVYFTVKALRLDKLDKPKAK